MDCRSLLQFLLLTVRLIKIFNQCISTWQLWGVKKHISPGIQILASRDRWEMNAARLVPETEEERLCYVDHMCDCVLLFFFVLVRVSMKAPASPVDCLLITQICAQSEEIMNEGFNYASRQRIPDASTTPLALRDGWEQVKQKPSPLGAQSCSALNADRARNLTWRHEVQTLGGEDFKQGKKRWAT